MGDFEAALDWVERSPSPGGYRSADWTQIRLICLRELGRDAELPQPAWDVFSKLPSPDAFAALVAEVGETNRTQLAQQATQSILSDPKVSSAKASLLLNLGLPVEAEPFVLTRAKQVDGMEGVGVTH